MLSVEIEYSSLDLIAARLRERGYSGGLIVEGAPDGQSAAGQPVLLRIYLPADAQGQRLLAAIRPSLRPFQVSEPALARLQDAHSQEAWKAHYAWRSYDRVQRAGARFVVVPFWESFEAAPGELVLRIDPATGFGTGIHPTTRVGLELLERYTLTGAHALDLGAGSGILSIAMARLGARVVAVDNDPGAVAAIHKNITFNDLHKRISVHGGSLGAGAALGHWLGWNTPVAERRLQAQARFDLIAANMLARIHIALSQDYRRALYADGLLVISGVIAAREPEVTAALQAAGFMLIERQQAADWAAQVYRPAEGAAERTGHELA